MALVCAANSSSGYTGREGEGVKLYSAAAGFKVKLDFCILDQLRLRFML